MSHGKNSVSLQQASPRLKVERRLTAAAAAAAAAGGERWIGKICNRSPPARRAIVAVLSVYCFGFDSFFGTAARAPRFAVEVRKPRCRICLCACV